MSQVSPVGTPPVTIAAALGVLPLAGVWVPALSPKADHQPCRMPCATSWLVPSSKSAITSPLAGAPQARLPLLPPRGLPPVPLLPPVAGPPPPVPGLPPPPVVPPVWEPPAPGVVPDRKSGG